MAQESKTFQEDWTRRILRVGIIGCGEIAQVAHISTLNFLSDYFTITYMCDVSFAALALCAAKIAGPVKTTANALELCASPDVDCVLICNATAFHPKHAILALQHDKHALVEKPLALCYRDIDAIAAAEVSSKGRVFVGYMRRYAAAFQDMLAELDSVKSEIQYVRVRDIIGPNSAFVNQSGTFPKRFSDVRKEDSDALTAMDGEMIKQALQNEFGVPDTKESRYMLGLLGSLGSHDLSAMREVIGVPQSITGASLTMPIWSAMLQYPTFSCTYESGINDVAVFDAHIEVYTPRKIIRVNYDTPYVKGLPTTVTVRADRRPKRRAYISGKNDKDVL